LQRPTESNAVGSPKCDGLRICTSVIPVSLKSVNDDRDNPAGAGVRDSRQRKFGRIDFSPRIFSNKGDHSWRRRHTVGVDVGMGVAVGVGVGVTVGIGVAVGVAVAVGVGLGVGVGVVPACSDTFPLMAMPCTMQL
jgi:hypothetical protein